MAKVITIHIQEKHQPALLNLLFLHFCSSLGPTVKRPKKPGRREAVKNSPYADFTG